LVAATSVASERAAPIRPPRRPEDRAASVEVPAQRIGQIVAGKRAVTADTDLRLCRLFGLSPGYWLRAQAALDTEVTAAALDGVLRKIKPWPRAVA
jgi:addiction module HigA family antidote